MKPKNLNKQKDRNEYVLSNEEYLKILKVSKQFGYMSSAVRFIKKFEAKWGKQNFSINKLDEGCYEVNNHIK